MSTIRVIGREDIQKVFTVTAALRAVESAYTGKSPISTSNPAISKARAYTV